MSKKKYLKYKLKYLNLKKNIKGGMDVNDLLNKDKVEFQGVNHNLMVIQNGRERSLRELADEDLEQHLKNNIKLPPLHDNDNESTVSSSDNNNNILSSIWNALNNAQDIIQLLMSNLIPTENNQDSLSQNPSLSSSSSSSFM